jgi:hypothetical protein
MESAAWVSDILVMGKSGISQTFTGNEESKHIRGAHAPSKYDSDTGGS